MRQHPSFDAFSKLVEDSLGSNSGISTVIILRSFSHMHVAKVDDNSLLKQHDYAYLIATLMADFSHVTVLPVNLRVPSDTFKRKPTIQGAISPAEGHTLFLCRA